jgi:hypothetical protein
MSNNERKNNKDILPKGCTVLVQNGFYTYAEEGRNGVFLQYYSYDQKHRMVTVRVVNELSLKKCLGVVDI